MVQVQSSCSAWCKRILALQSHGRLHYLNQHWFENLDEARQVLERWRIEYNTERPHSALKDRTPAEYLVEWALADGNWDEGEKPKDGFLVDPQPGLRVH